MGSTVGTAYRRQLGVAMAAMAVGLSGCAAGPITSPGSIASVAQSEAGTPEEGTWGAEREDRGPVAKAPRSLRACMTRNDGVIAWRTTEISKEARWHAQGRQEAHRRVIRAVQKYMKEFRQQTGISDNRDGFLGYDLDPANSRLIMQIDPSVLNASDFGRMVDKAARKANRAVGVRGRPLTVTVQHGCFTASEIARLVKTLWKNPRVAYLIGGVKLDGRLYAGFCGPENRAYARKVQRRLGPVLAIAHCAYVARGPVTVQVEGSPAPDPSAVPTPSPPE